MNATYGCWMYPRPLGVRVRFSPINPVRHARVLAAPLVALLLCAVAVVGGATASPAAASTTTLSGAYEGGGDINGIKAFGTWRGRSATVATDFLPYDTWSALSNPTWLADTWSGKGIRMALSVPMLPKSGGSMSTGASGGYNAYFKTLSALLVSRGLGNSIIRIGWEMNGTWYSWSAVNNPTAYVNYWRQIVSSMRSVTGAAYQFDWAPNIGYSTSTFNVASAYPGDSYVDIIGLSFYDQDWKYASSDVLNRWSNALNQPYGLNWHASFAASHYKSNALSEWGLSRRCDGHGGNDNPYYIQKVRDWVVNHPYAYESYFDLDMGSCEQHVEMNGTFPNAASSYKQLFGASTSTSTSTSSLDPSTLRLSWSSDRSNATGLASKAVSGKVYIFEAPGMSTTRVRFYLDDTSRSKTPHSTETYAPYDFAGGTTTTAYPFDTSTLWSGSHTLTVAVDTSTGTKVATVSFTH